MKSLGAVGSLSDYADTPVSHTQEADLRRPTKRKGGWYVLLLRTEFQAFASACELLITTHAGKHLSEDERDLIKYYTRELPVLLNVSKK